jgi:hypothetical protein
MHQEKNTTRQTTGAHSDVFASGLERIEIVGGGCLRFVMYAMEQIEGRMCRVEMERAIVMPLDALPDAIGKALMAMGRQVMVRPDGQITVAH